MSSSDGAARDRRSVPAPLAGITVRGRPAGPAERLVVRHLCQLGAIVEPAERSTIAGPITVTCPQLPAIRCALDWTDTTGTRLDEGTAQAAYGLMAVHGRARGGPRRLRLDYVSAAAGVLAVQGVLAAVLAGLRGMPVEAVEVSVAGAALVTVSQYLAAGSVVEPDEAEFDGTEFDGTEFDGAGPGPAAGVPPPFVSADGVWFEIEALDPEPWRCLWSALGVDPRPVARGWRAFVLRYANASAPLPADLHAATRVRGYDQLRSAAAAAGLAILPLRGHTQRMADFAPSGRVGPPWAIRAFGVPPEAGQAPPGLPELSAAAALPLAGLTVVEAGRRVQGPLAGHLLGQLGAEVIRIEPVGGDPLRGMAPTVGGCSARFLALNRHKRVVEADLRSSGGWAAVRDAVAGADVFLHNWAPGKAAGFGLDSADFAGIHPGLVYAYASGWGDVPVDGSPPGTDFLVQAYAGFGEQLRAPGEPPAGSLMTLLDVFGGLISAQGVLAGLVARVRGGRGQRVDSDLLAAAGVLQAPLIESGGTPGRLPGAAAGQLPVEPLLVEPLPVADGHVMLAAGSSADVLSRATAAASQQAAAQALR
ncbi:CoA transferase, partial [Frankia sp. Cj3]|uniref:CoA transferase n=1 Tax=Frankia sp. Cj3 TaxID=2880976 RepID=UPI001EF5F742